MKLRTRLQQLERQVAELVALRPREELRDDAFETWCRDGCLGPLPPAGPRPAKYRSDEEWQKQHTFLLALCCRSVGRDDPPDMSVEERREVEDTVAFFASIDPTGQLSLPEKARLAPYAETIKVFRVRPADRVLDSRGPMSSERRASSWPTANRAIHAKNNTGDA